jgi:hypothetical protein
MRKSAIVAFVLLASFVAQSSTQACMGGFGWGSIRSQPKSTVPLSDFAIALVSAWPDVQPDVAPLVTLSDFAVALVRARISWRITALTTLREAGCRMIWGGNNHTRE